MSAETHECACAVMRHISVLHPFSSHAKCFHVLTNCLQRLFFFAPCKISGTWFCNYPSGFCDWEKVFLLFQCNSYVCIQVKGFYFVVFIPRPTKCAWSSFYYLAPLCFASLMFYFPPHMATLAHLLMFPTRMLSVGYLCAAPWTGVLPISFMA